MKFYSKVSPQVRLQLASGRNLQFDNVDGAVGIHRTTNLEIAAELEACIRNETGGVTEITEAEYNALAEKKTTFRAPWREEIGKHGSAQRLSRTSQPESPTNVAVSDERFPDAPVQSRTAITPQPTPAFRPESVRRTET